MTRMMTMTATRPDGRHPVNRAASRWRLALLLPGLLALGGVLHAETVAFIGVNVVPMDREVVLSDQTVLVEDETIRTIGPRGSVTVPARRPRHRRRRSIPAAGACGDARPHPGTASAGGLGGRGAVPVRGQGRHYRARHAGRAVPSGTARAGGESRDPRAAYFYFRAIAQWQQRRRRRTGPEHGGRTGR